MSENLSQAKEDYLKVIYELTQNEERASTNAIADRLGVRPASVTWMLRQLSSAAPALIEYRKYQGVILTEAGKAAALKIIRQHRLLESFLHKRLGFFWDEVHEVAERLEHVMSAQLEERIAHDLGDPAYDPHGEPIPNRDLQIPEQDHLPLNEMRPDQSGVVQQVEADDPGFLRYLEKIGLTPQTRLCVTAFSPYDENLSLKIAEKEDVIILGPRVTAKIFMRVLDD